MACPSPSSQDTTTPEASEYPSDASVEHGQLNAEDCCRCPQHPDLDVHQCAASGCPSEQGSDAVHWSTFSTEHEPVSYASEDRSAGGCWTFDDSASTESQAIDTPGSSFDSSVDEPLGTFCSAPRELYSQHSDTLAVSDDDTASGASSDHAHTHLDALRERFLACDGPWSTYNRRLELPAFDYDHYQPGHAVHDGDDSHGNGVSHLG